VGKAGTKPNPNKIKVVVEFPIPRIVTNVQTFIGLIGNCKNYIKGYTRIIIPLFELTKHDVTFEWTLEGQKAFDQLKQALISTPILARPYFCKGSLWMWISLPKVLGLSCPKRKGGRNV
jgi:hypothetical protein